MAFDIFFHIIWTFSGISTSSSISWRPEAQATMLIIGQCSDTEGTFWKKKCIALLVIQDEVRYSSEWAIDMYSNFLENIDPIILK